MSKPPVVKKSMSEGIEAYLTFGHLVDCKIRTSLGILTDGEIDSPSLKAGLCSGLTLSGVFPPLVQRRGLAPSKYQRVKPT